MIFTKHGGYNICTNIPGTPVHSILVPDIKMPYQLPGTGLMAKTGIASMIHPDELTAEKHAQSMIDLFQSSKSEHNIVLDGAEKTMGMLESLCL